MLDLTDGGDRRFAEFLTGLGYAGFLAGGGAALFEGGFFLGASDGFFSIDAVVEVVAAATVLSLMTLVATAEVTFTSDLGVSTGTVLVPVSSSASNNCIRSSDSSIWVGGGTVVVDSESGGWELELEDDEFFVR